MSYLVYQRADGTKILRIDPSEWVKNLPPYDAWLSYLSSVRAYRQQVYVLEDGKAKLHCIGCNTLWSKLDLEKIRVGALVRLDYTADQKYEEDGSLLLTVKTRAIPVSKEGMGCGACLDQYQQAIAEVADYNALIEHMAKLYAELAIVQGPILNKEGRLVDRTAKKALSKRVAFMDITEQLQGRVTQ